MAIEHGCDIGGISGNARFGCAVKVVTLCSARVTLEFVVRLIRG